jgi:phospholipase C
MVVKVNRRELLKLGTVAAAEFAAIATQGCGGSSVNAPAGPPVPATSSKLSDIDHVVIFIQENRSFDHYFGSYRGVRGFSDKSPAFQQPDPANTSISPIGSLLPFHLDGSTGVIRLVFDDGAESECAWHTAIRRYNPPLMPL